MRPLAHARLLLSCPLLLLALQAQARPQAPTAAASESEPRQLTVAALELPSRDDAQWKQRREQVAQLLTELQPDVISVQQVLQQQGRNPACWLASRLRYSCDFVTADPPSQPLRHGNAMLTRLPVSEDGVTLLHPPGTFSAAGMMRLKLGEALVNIYVARLRPDPDEATARQHQTSDLMTWIGATAEGMPSLIAGDFSANTVELVRSTPGFQPARRNPGGQWGWQQRPRPGCAVPGQALRRHPPAADPAAGRRRPARPAPGRDGDPAPAGRYGRRGIGSAGC